MRIGIHAGHNPDGQIACGAVGLIKESTEARKVKDETIRLLNLVEHTTYDCTVENGKSVSDIVGKQVAKSNAQELDLTVAIHFNSGRNDKKGDGVNAGVEVLATEFSGIKKEVSDRICNNVSKLGFRNRGLKKRTDLSFLNKTTAKAILVECCFVDDADDIKLYDYKTMAKAIAEGIHGSAIIEPTYSDTTIKTYYRVVAGSFTKRENADNIVSQLNKKGYNSFISTFTKDNVLYYRAIAGSYSVKSNADSQVAKLKKDGYSAFIEVYTK